ncbi:MAG TPA: geranylgeranylglycerol-phosphate geranylgeranyltransferase [Bacteroidia bacterium]|nr:geranylgeranylglycerol-phosphate geranylgeranyltransferase [Bacteroidia bacterium]
MNWIKSFLRLIRFPNLIIILFSQYMVRFALLSPYYKSQGFTLQLPESIFLIFSLAFACMAAGGYIINDYYDVKADNINRPAEKVIVGKNISPDLALLLYWIFTITGICLGCWSATKIGLPMLGLLFFFYASGLWFYTTSFKYLFLVGNVLVSLFIAFVPFTAGFVELYTSVTNMPSVHNNLNFSFLLKGVSAISIFAFLITLVREIVKDMEDVEGDVKAGCRTLPIVWGIESGKKAAGFVLIVLFALLCYVISQFWKIKDGWSIVYIVCLIQIPMLINMLGLSRANSSRDFHKISSVLKLLMLSGISYLFVFAYICLH